MQKICVSPNLMFLGRQEAVCPSPVFAQRKENRKYDQQIHYYITNCYNRSHCWG